MRNFERDGVPWETICDKIEDGKPEGNVRGYSRKLLHYSYEEDDGRILFEIQDKKKPVYHQRITADLYGDTFTLALRTKGCEDDETLRHPDMRGKEFVRNSLRLLLGKTGSTPRTFIGVWCNATGYDDNYIAFMRSYKTGRHTVDAAKRTWSGRTLGEYGYQPKHERDIIITPGQIIATFTKSGKSRR